MAAILGQTSHQGFARRSRREILILRNAVRCCCDYEWSQHVPIALAEGMTRGEIDRLATDVGAAEWSVAEGVLLAVVDDLHGTCGLSDTTWSALVAHYSESEIVEMLAVVGAYTSLSFLINTVGVKLEPGAMGLPQRS